MKDSLTENFLDLKSLVFTQEFDDIYDISGKIVDRKFVNEDTLVFIFTDGTDFNIPLRRVWNSLIDKADALSKDDKDDEEFRRIIANLIEMYGYPLNKTAEYTNKAGRLVAF
jgi:hypothetical protein